MPSHRDQDLNAPDVDPVDTPFKRRLALSVALIALLGSVLGYAASYAGTREDEAAREAQKYAVLAMSEQSAALAQFYDYLGEFTTTTVFKQRKEIADARANLLAIPGESASADHWKQASSRLVELSPTLQEEASSEKAALAWAESTVKPTLARLHQLASRQAATDWGDKASAYVGGITLLAVTLALLGLSTTITARTRPFFWWPAAVVTATTLAGFLLVTLKPVPNIPEGAMKAVAQGDRLLLMGEHRKAMDSYTLAVRESNEYALAYERRAEARAAAENPGAQFVTNVMSPQARRENIADLDHALRFGEKTFANLANQGANYFHVRNYKKMEELTRQALRLNDGPPIPHLNLALSLAAQGRTEEAEKEFRRSVTFFDTRSSLERGELYASARTQLEILLHRQPERRDSILRHQGMLVESEASTHRPGTRIPADSASAQRLQLELKGSEIQVSMAYQNIPKNSLVSRIFYFRQDPAADWLQRHDLSTFERFSELPPSGEAYWSGPVELQCPSAGDYRVDVYANNRLLASKQTTRQPGSGDLRLHYDPLGRYTLCHPSAWKTSTNDAGHVTIESPDGEQVLRIRAVPIPLPLEGRGQLSETALESLAEEIKAKFAPTAGGAQQATLGGEVGTLRRFSSKDGRTAIAWASIQDEGMLRTLVVEYRDAQDAQLIGELLTRIKFHA
ncbi:hypothetical protein ABT246_16855 [Streptomyces sp. NPDC001553]|uniref:hypothetical protein n=1 Tax=Streptomyces sp. NPDC001553 TaxID=3154385 RepID=UPI00332E2449